MAKSKYKYIITTKTPMYKKKCVQWFYMFMNNLKKKTKSGGKTTQLEKNLLPQETRTVSEKQLLMLVTEILKAKQKQTPFSWTKISKALNTEGPVINSAAMW